MQGARVLLSGYYGFGNLGDEALLSGLSGALQRRGVSVTVLSADPAATRASHGVSARHRVTGLLPGVLAADAVVSGGGGLLQDGSSRRSLSYYLGVLRLAKTVGRPAAVYAQSLGPLSDTGRRRVAAVLAGVPTLVRDAPSLALAAALGVRASLVADPALLLGPTHTPDHDGRGGPVVLVPRGGHPELTDALVRLATRLVADGKRVDAVAMHPAEDEREVGRLVTEVAGVTRRTASTPDDALRLFSAAGYVVSVRLHGCILAARAGTAFAGLSYDPKVMGFLEQVNAPVFTAPVDEEALVDVVTAGAGFDADAVSRLRVLAERGVDELLASLLGSSAPRTGG